MPFLIVIYNFILAIVGAIVVGSVCYLTVLLAAAAFRRRSRGYSSLDLPITTFTVLVPAHNEELVIAATLESLAAQKYPRNLYDVVVIADNCTDSTPEIALRNSAKVWERKDSEKRGKGYALDWAITRLMRQDARPDAVVIVDADTWVDPLFLAQAASALAAHVDAQGRCALQGRYGVLNANDGWRAALMSAAFDLFNHVKPLGRDSLRLSVGLKGNGMVFSRRLLEEARWRGESVTEDIDFGLDLIRNHGIRVCYMPEAHVRAQMPATTEQATSQRKRWEGGRYRLMRQRGLPLLWEGLRRRSARLCDSAVDILLLPLAELGVLWLVWTALIAIGVVSHFIPWRPWLALALVAAGGLLVYILGGLRVAKAPRAAYAALARAPFYAAWKMVLYLRNFGRLRRVDADAAVEWVRTPRISAVETIPPPAPSSEGKAA